MRVDPSDLRASDADREAAADVLRAQCAAGWLDVSERRGLPGLSRFHYVDVFESDRRKTFARALEHIVPAMMRAGYDVV